MFATRANLARCETQYKHCHVPRNWGRVRLQVARPKAGPPASARSPAMRDGSSMNGFCPPTR
eukprot:8764060-Lingulodinium_polyedra.AAC.1